MDKASMSSFAYLPVDNWVIPILPHLEVNGAKFLSNLSSIINSSLEEVPNEFQFKVRCNLAYRTQFVFDYLGRTSQPPKLFYEYMISTLYEIDAIKLLNMSGSVNTSNLKANKELDVYRITRDSFNFMWPRNTKGMDYKKSMLMVEPRVEQLTAMMDEEFIPLSILDSGCGPGRYLDSLSKKYPKAVLHGLDQGKDIIGANKDRFDANRFKFHLGLVNNLPFDSNSFDMVLSVGVLHHVKDPIQKTIDEHIRVLKPGGYLFVFIMGAGGLEMSMWTFLRDVMRPVPKEFAHQIFATDFISTRVQGLLDHCYGEYFLTGRDLFESILKKYGDPKRVPGVTGLDVTAEAMNFDPYFNERYGEGQLRYLLRKS